MTIRPRKVYRDEEMEGVTVMLKKKPLYTMLERQGTLLEGNSKTIKMVGYNMRMPGPIPKQPVWKKEGYFWFVPKDINIPPKKPLINLIPRDEWGALPAKGETTMTLPLKHIRYNQTKTDNCIGKEDCIKIVKQLQKEHMDNGLPDIKYNFLIGGDGTVYEGRGWNNKPEIHAALQDKDYYDVAYIGSYGEYRLPIRMIYALYLWIEYGADREVKYLDRYPDLRHGDEPDELPKIYNPFNPLEPPKHDPLNPKRPRGEWWPTQAQEMKTKFRSTDFTKINIFTGKEAKNLF